MHSIQSHKETKVNGYTHWLVSLCDGEQHEEFGQGYSTTNKMHRLTDTGGTHMVYMSNLLAWELNDNNSWTYAVLVSHLQRLFLTTIWWRLDGFGIFKKFLSYRIIR